MKNPNNKKSSDYELFTHYYPLTYSSSNFGSGWTPYEFLYKLYEMYESESELKKYKRSIYLVVSASEPLQNNYVDLIDSKKLSSVVIGGLGWVLM